MKRTVVQLDGREQVVWSEQLGDHLWLHCQGETWWLPVEVRGRKKSQRREEDPSVLRAPMPGKIIKVPVQLGAQVTAGQVLVVLEAMKMEYTLKAGRDGKIAELLCREGEQVSLQQVLVRLQPVEPLKNQTRDQA